MKRIIGLALAVAALAAGCGSTADKNEYVNSVNQAQAALTTTLTKINPAGKPNQIAAELDEGGEAIDTAVKDLQAITPPDDATKPHGRIVNGLSALASTFHDAADAARAKDTAKMAELLNGIQTSAGAKELETAQRELMANGYKFEEA
ncbi:hypothetical protein DVA67_027490 [Solirubrobacter sp. CPCC 204708]|uniref:Lipoprotein n=1 Tax=Solirubrobacter deserti TaxID=2282478 RepID=A0ABT4RKG4_9ACTN|nr:hypothetical protein [Solirubrobacter deserti]MBE2319744.1 hypothetical protein [Solirubrobacter deserti]MDA0138775.1 hypothetical protein [Solirubrobacter deserti]